MSSTPVSRWRRALAAAAVVPLSLGVAACADEGTNDDPGVVEEGDMEDPGMEDEQDQ